MGKHHIVYSTKTGLYHVQIILFKWRLTPLITYWYIQSKEMWQIISCQRSEQKNIISKTKPILNSRSLIYLECNPPWCINSFLSNGHHTWIKVKSISILRRTLKRKYRRFSTSFRRIFFDVVLMGKKSTSFQRTLFDVILNWWAKNQRYLDVLST